MFDRFQSFDEIRLNSIDFQYRMFDYVRRDTKVVKTKSFFPFPSDHENYLPVQSRLVPRDLTLLLTFYNQCCCSGLHVLLNYICTRRSLYFLEPDRNHASSSTFSSSYPRMHLRSVRTKAASRWGNSDFVSPTHSRSVLG